MKALATLLIENEEWLMQRILTYAKDLGFAKYTSTLQEAWRLSVSGLTASICNGIQAFDTVPELGPDDDYSADALSEFGLLEAQRHRKRGVTLAMFLGLMKYYRQSYIDLLAGNASFGSRDRMFIERCFDRIEVSYCQEWSSIGDSGAMAELQTANRTMTNEKNAYLTVFESLSDPVMMLDNQDRLVNLNQAASLLADPDHVPGGHYYQADERSDGTTPYGKHKNDTACIGRHVGDVYPWLLPTLRILREGHGESVECETLMDGKANYYEVKCSTMLDVSEKFTSLIILLRNITKRKYAEIELKKTVAELGLALSEVKKLSGLLPICANCKRVRDDKGYWNQVEEYITVHSDATFSHGICPECLRKFYPEIADAVMNRRVERDRAKG
jgi:PAS domain-containing protein